MMSFWGFAKTKESVHSINNVILRTESEESVKHKQQIFRFAQYDEYYIILKTVVWVLTQQRKLIHKWIKPCDKRHSEPLGEESMMNTLFINTHKKKRVNPFLNQLFLNLDPATSYLSGRSSSEYCHRYQSLRSCSGWERVVSWRFVTGNLAYSALRCYINSRFSHFPYTFKTA